MNTTIFLLFLIKLNAYVNTKNDISPCLETSLLNKKNPKKYLNFELTEDICRIKETSDKKNLICLLSEDHKQCEEFPKSVCITKFLGAHSIEKLSDDDCIGLETSNGEYTCVLNIDRNRCIEKTKKLRALDDDDDIWDDFWDDLDDKKVVKSECELSKNIEKIKYNLTEEYCSRLGTHSYRNKCILSYNGYYCVELKLISDMNKFKLFILILYILFLF